MNQKKTILVVEDHPLNRKLVVDLLKLGGFGVLEARDGESALVILKNTLPDLILIDIGLPGMDGFEVLKKIREDSRLASVKALAVTALAMHEDREKIKSAGFHAVIIKPIDTALFMTTIKDMLGSLL